MKWKDVLDGEIVEIFREGVQCGLFEKIDLDPPSPAPDADVGKCDCDEPLMNAWSPNTGMIHLCPNEEIADMERAAVLANRNFTGYILFKNFARAEGESRKD